MRLKKFSEIHSGWLVVLGGAAFFLATSSAWIVAIAVSRFAKALEKNPAIDISLNDFQMLMASFILLFPFLIGAWWAGHVASRCNQVLKDRWFQ